MGDNIVRHADVGAPPKPRIEAKPTAKISEQELRGLLCEDSRASIEPEGMAVTRPIDVLPELLAQMGDGELGGVHEMRELGDDRGDGIELPDPDRSGLVTVAAPPIYAQQAQANDPRFAHTMKREPACTPSTTEPAPKPVGWRAQWAEPWSDDAELGERKDVATIAMRRFRVPVVSTINPPTRDQIATVARPPVTSRDDIRTSAELPGGRARPHRITANPLSKHHVIAMQPLSAQLPVPLPVQSLPVQLSAIDAAAGSSSTLPPSSSELPGPQAVANGSQPHTAPIAEPAAAAPAAASMTEEALALSQPDAKLAEDMAAAAAPGWMSLLGPMRAVAPTQEVSLADVLYVEAEASTAAPEMATPMAQTQEVGLADLIDVEPTPSTPRPPIAARPTPPPVPVLVRPTPDAARAPIAAQTTPEIPRPPITARSSTIEIAPAVSAPEPAATTSAAPVPTEASEPSPSTPPALMLVPMPEPTPALAAELAPAPAAEPAIEPATTPMLLLIPTPDPVAPLAPDEESTLLDAQILTDPEPAKLMILTSESPGVALAATRSFELPAITWTPIDAVVREPLVIVDSDLAKPLEPAPMLEAAPATATPMLDGQAAATPALDDQPAQLTPPASPAQLTQPTYAAPPAPLTIDASPPAPLTIDATPPAPPAALQLAPLPPLPPLPRLAPLPRTVAAHPTWATAHITTPRHLLVPVGVLLGLLATLFAIARVFF